MTKPTAMTPAVSTLRARQQLHLGERRVRQLIRSGRLQVTGEGHSRKVTAESLDAEVARRNARKLLRSKYRNLSHSDSILPNFSDRDLASEKGSRHNDVDSDMRLSFHNQRTSPEPSQRLLSQARAASELGVSAATFRAAVASGQVRSILLGKRKRIPVEVIRELASGLKEST